MNAGAWTSPVQFRIAGGSQNDKVLSWGSSASVPAGTRWIRDWVKSIPSPSIRRTGARVFGTALMSLALRHLASDGYDEVIVWTVEGYKRGIAFYEAMGWRRDGGVRDEGRQDTLQSKYGSLASLRELHLSGNELTGCGFARDSFAPPRPPC